MSKPVIVVTGASKGIGLCVAKLLLEEFGAIVVAISRTRSPELVKLLETHRATLLTVECSVSDEAGLTEAITLAQRTYGRIDGLILNAGVLDPLGPIHSHPLDAWKTHFDVNFFSLITALKASLPILRKNSGKVVFVSSGAATGGIAGWGAYNASKAAMNSLCRTLANEEPEITCVALRPGMVDTGMQAHLRENGPKTMAEGDMKRFIDAYADGSLVKPEDCGYVIAALAIKAHKSLSGQFVSWNEEACADYRRPGHSS